ncbi:MULTISPECIES: hypothetical protein [Deefgea]|uniref:Uncharacterized protein n=1 Tax=Deefgea chitinilytica TaxID=570276 RepID=A0ABS2CAD5_9NEIS|nr:MULTISPECIES: hypothetical protein [Deefgea]MBM5571108.1 hypothetical protein [Deefgea chitinilytica]MBM9888338.1 hypothetical protein [Deefgea sp. CFH1-16]
MWIPLPQEKSIVYWLSPLLVALLCPSAFADQSSFGIVDFIAAGRNEKLAKKYIDGAKIANVRRKDLYTKDGLPFGIEYEIDFSVTYPFKFHGANGASELINPWPILYESDEDSNKRIDFRSTVPPRKYIKNGEPYTEIHPKKGDYTLKYYLLTDLMSVNKKGDFCIRHMAHKFTFSGYKNIPRSSHADAIEYIANACEVNALHLGKVEFDIQVPDGGKVLYANKDEVFHGNACTYLINFIKSNPPICE